MAYVIGSQKGKDKAKEMKSGEKWTNTTDGSVWEKKPDGSVSVTHNGQTFNNAYPPTSSSGGTGSNNNQYTQYKPTGTYNDLGLPNDVKTQIDTYKEVYNNAIASGDKKTAEAAHAMAEMLRKEYGYSGGGDGSEYIKLKADPSFDYSVSQPTYESKYDPQIEALLNEILTREDFSYDVTKDPLYEQYAKMYQREGDRAMKETLAEAAASAGGMNTYAITAAQQANSYYGSQLNDKIPELYQLAYEMYLNDKESKVQDLGILQNMDATQYNRYRDTMADWKDDRQFAYGMYRDDVADSQWDKTFNYNSYWDTMNFGNDNYWKNKDLELTNREWDYNTSTAEEDKAKAEIEWYIENGVTTINPELIKRAGLDQTAINQMIAKKQAEEAAKNSKNTTGSDVDKKKVEDDGKKKKEEEDDDDGYTPKFSPTSEEDEGDGTVIGLGIGPVSDDMLEKLAKAGAIEGDENGNLYWANGWNRENYKQRLDDFSGWSNLITLPGLNL